MENKIQTILTLNGKQYSVQAPPGYVLEPADIEHVKQDILSGKIQRLNPATCKDVLRGAPQQITLTASGGVPNYTYRLLLDGTEIAAEGPIAATSKKFDYTFLQAVGSHVLKGEIKDSCSTPQTSSDQCTTFNIVACPTPNCDFTWSPANPTVNDTITVTSSDTTLTSQVFKLGGFDIDIAYGSPFTMQISTAGTYSIQHDGTNVCGNTCTLTKNMVISPVCSALGVTMNIA